MFLSSHYLKIRSSPNISWLLVEKRQVLRCLQVAIPISVQLHLSRRRLSKPDGKWNFFVPRFSFPSLLPRDSEPFAVRAWEERKGRRRGDFLFAGPVSEWLCGLWSDAWQWFSQSIFVGFIETPCCASLDSSGVPLSASCPIPSQALPPDRLLSWADFTSGPWDFCTFDLSLEGREAL